MGAFDDDDGAGQRVALGPGPFARLAVRLLAIGGVVAIGAVLLGGEVTLAQRAELPPSLLGPPPTVPERSVREAFATAFHALEDAGSFTYHGTVEADRASLARPGIQLDGPVRVEGGVFPGIGVSEEVATDRVGRVSETLTENVVVWGRQAPDLDALESQPFQVVFETGGAIAVPMGAALVPDWLSATSERRREAPTLGVASA